MASRERHRVGSVGYLRLIARQTFPNDLRLQGDPLLNRHVLEVSRQPRLALLIDHQNKPDRHVLNVDARFPEIRLPQKCRLNPTATLKLAGHDLSGQTCTVAYLRGVLHCVADGLIQITFTLIKR